MQKKKKKHNNIVMLTRSKLNSIESKISEVLINNKISHEDFTTIINEEQNNRELKESIRMMKTQRSDTKKIIWLKKIKEKALIKLLDIMHIYKAIPSYCLKCTKNTENINRKFRKLVMVKQWCYQIVLYVAVKNQNLSKNKKKMDYWVV